MAITRETDFVFDATRNADGLNRGAIRLLADDLNFGVGVQTFTTEGASLLTWTPGNVGAATNVLNYNGRGWAIHLSKFSVSGGTVRMPAQDILIRINITSTASSGLTLAVGQYTPTVSLWELGAASGQQRIAFTTGAQTATRGLGAPGFVVVTLSVPEWEFTTDSTLYIQVGGNVTAPQPAIGSSEETYTFEANGAYLYLEANGQFRAGFGRSAGQAVPAPGNAVERVASYVRKPGLVVPSTLDQASRLLDQARISDVSPEVLAAPVRQVRFPRSISAPVPPSVGEAIRRAVFRRPVGEVVDPVGDAARRVSAVRRTAEIPVDIDAVALRSIIYGRATSYYHQPSEDAVIDPTREIRVRVLNGDGTPHGAGAYVVLFRSDNNLAVQTAVTDGTSEVAFPRNSFDSFRYFVAAWDEDGVPLGQAVSERTLEPELAG